MIFIQLHRSAVTAASLLAHKSNLNNMQKLSSYLTVNTLRPHYKYS